ncbi:MAG TPA: hypothetical protein PLZ68_10415 [Ferruginibacter sp.]|nr:hypothetical protein [Ferruginibacter sp.]
MKKVALLSIAFLVILHFAGCMLENRAEETVEIFKKADGSLSSSNRYLNIDIKELFKIIDVHRHKNRTLALEADSIYNAVEAVSQFIDSLNQLQKTLDSSGERLDITEKILVGTPTGNELKRKLLWVSGSCYSTLITPVEKPALDSILSWINEIPTISDWDKRHFQLTPTVAGITILNKFENDCKNAASYSLSLIAKQLSK